MKFLISSRKKKRNSAKIFASIELEKKFNKKIIGWPKQNLSFIHSFIQSIDFSHLFSITMEKNPQKFKEYKCVCVNLWHKEKEKEKILNL